MIYWSVSYLDLHVTKCEWKKNNSYVYIFTGQTTTEPNPTFLLYSISDTSTSYFSLGKYIFPKLTGGGCACMLFHGTALYILHGH